MTLATYAADDRFAGEPASSAAGSGRLEWLCERLAELGDGLGRVPTTAELSEFLRKHQIGPTECDALIAVASPRPARRAERPAFARTPADTPPPRPSPDPMAAAGQVVDRPPHRLAEPDEVLPPADEDREGPAPLSDNVVSRAVDDLVDDWHRAGCTLRYDDVTRLVTKRELSAEQIAAVLVALDDRSVEVGGLASRVGATDEASDEGENAPPGSMSSDIVRSYLRELRRYPMIWADDEVRLGRQIQAGLAADAALSDERRLRTLSVAQQAALGEASAAGRLAHVELVCANLRLVVSIAKHRSFANGGVEFIDRIQDGNAGLMHAADKFDPTLGYKFSTYATWWIRQAIDRGIGDRGRLVRVPVHAQEKLVQMRRAQRELADRLDRDPTATELAEDLDWAVATVQAMLDWSRPAVSLDVLVGTEGDTTLGDLLSEQADVDGRTDPVNCVIDSACVRDLDQVLNVLDGRSAEVIRRRYGLHDGDKETLDEIGEHFGVTRERIRQIESKALERLQQPRNNGLLRSYFFDDDELEHPQRPSAERPVPRRRSVDRRSKATTGEVVPPQPPAQQTGMREINRQLFLSETVAELVDAS